MKTTDNDKELRRMMKEIRLEKPGAGFSSRVMDAVIAEAAKKSAYRTEPVLGAKFWIFVALFVALAIILMLLGNGEPSAGKEMASELMEKFPATDLSTFKNGVTRFLVTLSGLPVTLSAIMIATSALILADKYFGARHRLHLG